MTYLSPCNSTLCLDPYLVPYEPMTVIYYMTSTEYDEVGCYTIAILDEVLRSILVRQSVLDNMI